MLAEGRVVLLTLTFACSVVLALPACETEEHCMRNGYRRSGVGTAEFSGPGGVQGSLPTSVVLHRFQPFQEGACDFEADNTFEVEVAPTCRLQTGATSRKYDKGRYASLDFLQAEAIVRSSQPCALLLDGREVRGTIHSGTVDIHPRSLEITFGLFVTEGNGVAAPGAFISYRADVSWVD
jgi:hypothetical protein